MPELAFVMSPNQNWFFREFVETLRHELSQQGLPSTVHTDGFPEPTPERVYALVPPHEFVALEGEAALPDEAILRRTIFICAEQPSTVHLEQDIELSRRAGAVFDINSRSVAEFRRAGIPARHLRPGYSPMRDCFDPDVQRDIDVLFLGALTPRRTRWLGGCGRVLAPYNCHLLFSDNSRPNSRTSTTFLTDEKWDLLTRAKIVLNIHQTDEPYFEWLRVLDAIHAGAVVITEHASGVAPLVPGTHLLTASPESLPFVLDAALRDQYLLTQLRLAAHERIRTWLPFAMSASVVRAAAVELVGRPVPPGVRLGRRLTSRSKLPDRWTVVADADADADSRAIRRGLKDARLDLIDLRRQLGRLEHIVRSPDGATPHTTMAHQTPAWDLRREPRVSVITALYNHSHLVGAALDSVTHSEMREFELIVVDDGSSDDSCSTAAAWMSDHPWVPARLVAHGVNRGLGAATAIDFARAPYCFVLDADNEVYPRCLAALAWVLDAIPDVAFAYPMLEVFGLAPRGWHL